MVPSFLPVVSRRNIHFRSLCTCAQDFEPLGFFLVILITTSASAFLFGYYCLLYLLIYLFNFNFLLAVQLRNIIISKLSIRVQPKARPQGKKVPKRRNITKLKDVPTKQSFVEALDERLHTILLDEQDVEAA